MCECKCACVSVCLYRCVSICMCKCVCLGEGAISRGHCSFATLHRERGEAKSKASHNNEGSGEEDQKLARGPWGQQQGGKHFSAQRTQGHRKLCQSYRKGNRSQVHSGRLSTY